MLVLTMISIVFYVFGIGRYLTPYGIDYFQLLLFSAIIGFSGSIISLFMSKWMAKTLMKVRIINPNERLSSKEANVASIVTRVSQTAGIKVPEIGIYPSLEVNAFATGYSRNNSLVALSEGMIEKFDNEALEGVIAHEISHITSGDMVTMTLVQGIVNTFVIFLSRVFAYLISRLVNQNLAGIVHFVCIIIFQIVFSILATPLVMAFSRHREYRADWQASSLVGKQKMIKTLKSLENNLIIDSSNEAIMTFKISGENTFRATGQKKSNWRKLFSTHPDLRDRIERLEKHS